MLTFKTFIDSVTKKNLLKNNNDNFANHLKKSKLVDFRL